MHSLTVLVCSTLLLFTACQRSSMAISSDEYLDTVSSSDGSGLVVATIAHSQLVAKQRNPKQKNSSSNTSQSVSSPAHSASSALSRSRANSSRLPGEGRMCGGLTNAKCPAGCTCHYTTPLTTSDRVGKCQCAQHQSSSVPASEGGVWWWPF